VRPRNRILENAGTTRNKFEMMDSRPVAAAKTLAKWKRSMDGSVKPARRMCPKTSCRCNRIPQT